MYHSEYEMQRQWSGIILNEERIQGIPWNGYDQGLLGHTEGVILLDVMT